MIFLNAPENVDPEIWNFLNKIAQDVPPKDFSEFIKGIQQGIDESKKLLKSGSDEEIITVMSDKSITPEQAKFYMSNNIRTMKKWLDTYRHQK